jgi:colanic acid biosynthesis glycosyl transferase WcaI
VKIGFAVSVFPPETEPAAVMAGELCRKWTSAGHVVHVVTPFPNRPHGKIYEGFSRSIVETTYGNGYQHTRLWTWLVGKKRKVHNRLLENLTFGIGAGLVVLSMKRSDVLIIDSWPVFCQLFISMCAVIRRIPTINIIHDLFPEAMQSAGLLNRDGVLSQLILAFDSWVCRLMTANVVLSNSVLESFVVTRRVSRDTVYVIPYWLDIDEIRPFEGVNTWRAEQGILDEDFVFMFAGTLGYASGAGILAGVAQKLKPYRQIKIVCIGEGPLKAQLSRTKTELKLNNLLLLPFQPRGRLTEVQSAANAMLLITAENMGYSSVPSKFVTYLAVGRPVICAIGAQSEIAQIVETHKIGFVVSPGDSAGIVQALLDFTQISPPETIAMGTRARRTSVDLYSLSRAIQDFDELFSKVNPRAINSHS